MINFQLIIQSLPLLLEGTYRTLIIAASSCLLGIILGTILGLIEAYGRGILQWLVLGYVTIIRGTPMLIQISFWYFALGLDPFIAATLGIGLNSAAYVSQIIKAGIKAIGTGQIEAAYVLGLNQTQTIQYIVLPQTIRTVLPALGNELVTLIKDSSLASTIGVVELFRQASFIKTRTFDVVSVYVAMALIYLLLTGTLSFVLHYLEKRLNTHAQR